jgi:hypothetical protein
MKYGRQDGISRNPGEIRYQDTQFENRYQKTGTRILNSAAGEIRYQDTQFGNGLASVGMTGKR